MQVSNDEQLAKALSMVKNPEFRRKRPEQAKQLLGLSKEYQHNKDVSTFKSLCARSAPSCLAGQEGTRCCSPGEYGKVCRLWRRRQHGHGLRG